MHDVQDPPVQADGGYLTLSGARRNLPRSLGSSFLTLLNMSVLGTTTKRGEVLNYCLFAVIWMAAYTANLASIMVSDAQTYGTSSIDELNRDGLRACVKRGAAYVRKRRADGDDRVGADDGGERGAERVRGNVRAARDRDGPARVGPPADARLQ